MNEVVEVVLDKITEDINKKYSVTAMTYEAGARFYIETRMCENNPTSKVTHEIAVNHVIDVEITEKRITIASTRKPKEIALEEPKFFELIYEEISNMIQNTENEVSAMAKTGQKHQAAHYISSWSDYHGWHQHDTSTSTTTYSTDTTTTGSTQWIWK